MPGQEENLKTFAEAVERNSAVVLSLPSAGLVRNCKSRFLGECREGIWIETQHDAIPLIKQLLEKQHPMAVSFKGGVLRLSFVTTGIRFDPQFRINAQAVAPALLVQRPKEIKAAQRRAAYRVHLHPDCELLTRLWSISEQAIVRDRPMASSEVKADIRDISIGGLGIRLPPVAPDAHPLINDQRLRVQLVYKHLDVILEGRLRKMEAKPADANGPTVAGVVFKTLEGDVEGRQKLAALTRIVGELQREEVRRMRLGLAS